MTPKQFLALPRGERAFLMAADVWNWDRQAKAHKNTTDKLREYRNRRNGR